MSESLSKQTFGVPGESIIYYGAEEYINQTSREKFMRKEKLLSCFNTFHAYYNQK